MERNMSLRAAAIVAALTSGGLGSAQAGLVNFSWSPSAIGLTSNGTAGAGFTDIVNANKYNVSDFSANTITVSTGAFIEFDHLNILSFLNGGAPVNSFGLGQTASVSEPASVARLGAGLIGLAGIARHRRKA